MNRPENRDSGAEKFRQEFRRQISRPEEDLDLARAALLVAGEEYPDVEIDHHLGLLDNFAASVTERTTPESAPEERAREVGRLLFGELGFRGNSTDYYNPENSYFNRVLVTRIGIPITLSLLFIEVARRVGVQLHGVGMPGHFLVGLEGGHVFFDPFSGGESLTVDDCRRLAERLFGPRMTWDDRYLDPCTKYEFLFRILNNLKVVYERGNAPGKAAGVVERMLMVRPDATSLYQDLAALQQHLQQYRAAIVSLQSYLNERQAAPDAPQVNAWIDQLRVTLSRLN